MAESRRPADLKSLSDRELMEALYRAVYGEEPVHAGIAQRVKRLETGFWVLLLFVLGIEGVTKIPTLIN